MRTVSLSVERAVKYCYSFGQMNSTVFPLMYPLGFSMMPYIRSVPVLMAAIVYYKMSNGYIARAAN